MSEDVREFDFKEVWCLATGNDLSYQKHSPDLIAFMADVFSDEDISSNIYNCKKCLQEQFPIFLGDEFKPVYRDHSAVNWRHNELLTLQEKHGDSFKVKTIAAWEAEKAHALPAKTDAVMVDEPIV